MWTTEPRAKPGLFNAASSAALAFAAVAAARRSGGPLACAAGGQGVESQQGDPNPWWFRELGHAGPHSRSPKRGPIQVMAR